MRIWIVTKCFQASGKSLFTTSVVCVYNSEKLAIEYCKKKNKDSGDNISYHYFPEYVIDELID